MLMKNKYYWALTSTLTMLIIELICGLGNSLIGSSLSHLVVPEPFEEERELTQNSPHIIAHPYFGYVRNEGEGVNNHGFGTPQSFPINRKQNTIYIAVLGGSVADGFAGRMIRTSTFQRELKKNVPKLRDKNIEIVNLAISGYKQPQPFLISSLLNKNFDYAINIDGYNELFATAFPSQPISFPLWSQVLFNRLDGNEDLLTEIKISRKAIKSLANLSENFSFLKKSEFFIVATLFIKSYYSNKIKQKHFELENHASSKAQKFHPEITSFNIESIFPQAVENWVKYTKMQYQVLKNQNIPSAFFIQPIQYLKNSKPMTKEEKRVAIDDRQIRKVQTGYQLLLKEAEFLKKEKYPIFDLTSIFKNTKRPVYTDTCCHLNGLGDEIMAKEIASQLARSEFF